MLACRCLFLYPVVLALTAPLLAQQAKPATLEEELLAVLNTEVTVAGRKSQKISEAPAILSVVTSEDLERLGATSLYDALSLIPGIALTETSFGFTAVGIRGNLPTHYNNKVLLLINNHPAYDTAVGSFYLEQIPIAMVQRIEVLRGPGSTLYGTNAFTGVIKVVTKGAGEMGRGSGSIRAGRFGTKGFDVTAGWMGSSLKLAAAASYDGSNGYPYRVTRDENGRAGVLDYRNNAGSAFITLEASGYSLNLSFWQQRKDKFGLVPTLVSTGRRFHEGAALDLSRTWTLTDRLSLGFLVYADQLQKREDIAWYPPAWAQQQAGVGGPERQENKNRKAGADLQLTWSFASDWRLVGGAYREQQHTDPYLFVNAKTGAISAFKSSAYLEPHEGDDTGAYLQVDGRPLVKLGVSGGVRLNRNSAYGSKATPSVGFVFNATPRLTFKLLYGEAFRNPNFFEKYVASTNVLFGDEKLRPEKVRSTELGVDWFLTPTNSLRVNVFRTDSTDLIARAGIIPAGQLGNTRPTPQYANAAGQTFQGLEMENRGSLGASLSYFVNVSFLSGSEKKDDANVQYIPRQLANAGLTASITSTFRVSAYLQHVGMKEGFLSTGAPNDVASYRLLHVQSEYWPAPRLKLGLGVRNALDATWVYPEFIRRLVPSTPGGPDRAWLGSATWRF